MAITKSGHVSSDKPSEISSDVDVQSEANTGLELLISSSNGQKHVPESMPVIDVGQPRKVMIFPSINPPTIIENNTVSAQAAS